MSENNNFQPNTDETNDKKNIEALTSEEREAQKMQQLSLIYDKSKRDTSKKSKRKFWLKVFFVAVLMIASVFILFSIGDLVGGKQISFSEMIAGINVNYLWLLLGAVVLSIVLETAKYSYLAKVSTKKWHFRTSMKVMALGKFYDDITPLNLGGQPFQMYYLHKKDIPSGVASAIPLIRFFFSSIAWVTCGIVMISLCPMFVQNGSGLTVTIQILAWIGIIVNMAFPVSVLLITIFPKGGKKLVLRVFHLLYRLHFIRHFYTRSKNFLREIDKYRNAIVSLARRPLTFAPLVFFCFAETFLTMSLPFFVVITLTSIQPSSELFWQLLSLNFLASFSASFIPTPGTTGALETTSAIMFATVNGIDNVVGWIIMIWRIFTYYLYIIIGVILYIYEVIRDVVRSKRAERKAQAVNNDKE